MDVVTGVGNEVVDHVVLWIHGPDNFIQRMCKSACFLGDPANVSLDSIPGAFRALCQLTKNYDLRQSGPQVVVDVVGNSSPLRFNRAFLLDALNFALQFSPDYV